LSAERRARDGDDFGSYAGARAIVAGDVDRNGWPARRWRASAAVQTILPRSQSFRRPQAAYGRTADFCGRHRETFRCIPHPRNRNSRNHWPNARHVNCHVKG
jgi:hypothetical protein